MKNKRIFQKKFFCNFFHFKISKSPFEDIIGQFLASSPSKNMIILVHIEKFAASHLNKI